MRVSRSLSCSLAAASLAFAGLVLPLSSVAEACSTAQHCFGQTTNVLTPSGFLGGRVSIGPYCLVAPRGAGSTDELWLADGSQYWVEAGFVDNEAYSPHLPHG